MEVIQAEKIWIRPEGETPEDVEVIQAAIIEVDGGTIKADVTGVIADIWVETSQATEWEYANAPKWSESTWVNVSWLFGPYGVLGKYAHFHGTDRGVLRFDFGKSWSVARGKPISKIMQNRLKNTLTLTIAATVLSLVVSIPVGIYSAVKQYSRLDYIVTTFTFFGTAMPVFWQGLMQMTVWSRYTRASMLEVLRQDYVRTARAKGLAERLVIVQHAYHCTAHDPQRYGTDHCACDFGIRWRDRAGIGLELFGLRDTITRTHLGQYAPGSPGRVAGATG